MGADGARSTVRHAMGLPFEGMTYPETTLLVTTLFPFDEHLEGISNVSYCWKENGNFSLLKVPGRWRVSIYPDENIPIDDQMTPDALNAASADHRAARRRPMISPSSGLIACTCGWCRPIATAACCSPATPRISTRRPAAWASTAASMMRSSLPRALIDVLRHGAPEARLDAYDRRRRPIAREDILAQADRNRARMRERDPARRRELLKDLQATANDREKLCAFLRRSSMLEGPRRRRAAIS